jgi:glucose-6-phosphate dehydrogenase assembly protein OpcA
MPIRAEQIQKDLERLWEELARHGAGQPGVLRACALTLIVVCDASDDAGNIGATLAELMERHPARAVLLRVGEDFPEAEARVFAHCWLPRNGRSEICSEQIEITTNRARLGEIIPVLVALAAPDLPVAVWWRSSQLFLSPDRNRFTVLQPRMILDSERFDDLKAVFEQMAALLAGGHPVGDLAWARLTPLREALAQAYECARARLPISQIVQAAVTSATPAGAAYAAAWVAERLGWHLGDGRVRTEVRRQSIMASRMAVSLEGRSCSITVEWLADSTLETRIGDAAHRTFFPPPSEADLLAEELSLGPRDQIYGRCLSKAAEAAPRLS